MVVAHHLFAYEPLIKARVDEQPRGIAKSCGVKIFGTIFPMPRVFKTSADEMALNFTVFFERNNAPATAIQRIRKCRN
ncbi:hypothetical protein BC343_11790 [Mucilaginibacter pedocola]|uniref:Uncharacterized protein n=1 Tax=Mucilaginibacter pedocola TaxID=1792845 RepID=A0A1S9PBK6_9SPHI|nr:hypothetical protein BC343_11790 [Mucilaginibacter pedocola]